MSDQENRDLGRRAGDGDLAAARRLVAKLERIAGSDPGGLGRLREAYERFKLNLDSAPWARSALADIHDIRITLDNLISAVRDVLQVKPKAAPVPAQGVVGVPDWLVRKIQEASVTPRTCQNCMHAGWDPDGNYCAQPQAVERSGGFGLSLSSFDLAALCPSPEHPLFEAKSASKEIR